MKRREIAVVATALLGAAGLVQEAAAQFWRFDSVTAEGWRVFQAGHSGHISNPTADIVPPVDTVIGLAPPAIRVGDIVANTTVGAPSSALGNRTDLLGRYVAFDIYPTFRDAVGYNPAIMIGASITLYQPVFRPELNMWNRREFAIAPGTWRVNSPSGAVATEEQLLQVLGDLRALVVRTEYSSGNDNTWVDNILIGCIGVTRDPTDARPCLGGSVDLSVGTIGAAATSYQWRRDGEPLADVPGRISGSNARDLMIWGFATTDEGEYDCIVASACGEVTSGAAVVAMCRADFDCDGFVTGTDFDSFVSAFEAGEESSDFDGDGFVTGLDFDALVAAFEAGC